MVKEAVMVLTLIILNIQLWFSHSFSLYEKEPSQKVPEGSYTAPSHKGLRPPKIGRVQVSGLYISGRSCELQ